MARNANITVGENWIISGAGVINAGTSTVNLVAASGTKSIASRNQPFYDIAFNGAALFRITNNLFVNNDLNILNGMLDVSNSPSYNVYVAGDWTNQASFNAQTGTVVFNGSSGQAIYRSTGENYYNLTIQNTGSGVTLANGNVTVANQLTMVSGNIITGSYRLVVGTSVFSPGSLSRTAGIIVGNMTRWINSVATDYLFPVGSATEYHYAILRPVSGLTAGTVTISYIASDPGSTGLPLREGSDSVIVQFGRGYWNAQPANGFNCTNYSLSLLANFFSNGDSFVNAGSRILRRNNSGPWFLDGNHQDATITPTDTVCYRLALNGLDPVACQFTIGGTSCIGGIIASDQIVCQGVVPSPFTNVEFPKGGNGVFTYTWQYSTNLTANPGDGSWTDLPGSNAANYAYSSPITSKMLIVRKVTVPGCTAKYSNVLFIDMYYAPNTGPLYRVPNK